MLLDIDIPVTEREFRLFCSLIREHTGIALRENKRSLLNSRLLARLRYFGYQRFEEYYEHLLCRDPNGEEMQNMINAMTTNMTSFFREKHHFDQLTRHLLVPARESALRKQSVSLRLWSAGCSTGEEAYSIAMTVADNLDHLLAWDVKILATDIDTDVLKAGRAGVYPVESVRGMAQAPVRRHFLQGIGTHTNYVKVKPQLSRLVCFARLNLMDIHWPFRGKFDAIFCRNVIIYFDHDSQRRLLEHFARYLRPQGLFFAGHSESLFWADDLFEPIGHTVYRLRARETVRE